MVKLGVFSLQEVMEIVESLSPEDQTMLIEMIRQRLIQQRYDEIAKYSSARLKALQKGKGDFGSCNDLHKDLLSKP